jgi:hypothetical protein
MSLTDVSLQRELSLLTLQCLEADLSSDDQRRLTLLLTEHPKLIDHYVELMSVCSGVRSHLMQPAQGSSFTTQDHPVRTIRPRRDKPERLRHSLYTGLILAALLALVATAWFLKPLSHTPHAASPNPPSNTTAILTNTENAVFATSSPRLGDALAAGPIQLTSGNAQIMFDSTAVVDLTGPCEFEITGENRGRLASGVLEAFVPDRASGFTVDLPHDLSVVDLGTRFIVHVTEGLPSGVRVIQGAVRLTRNDSGESLNMVAGNTAYVSPDRPLTLDQAMSFPLALGDRTLMFVQAQPFDAQGRPGNTVRADDPSRPWSSPDNVSNDGLWCQRSVSLMWPDYIARAGVDGYFFETLHADKTNAPEIVTTVSNLPPARYEVYIVFVAANNELWASRADLNAPAVTRREPRSAINASPLPAGIRIVRLGETESDAAGFNVHVLGEPAAVRSEYIGVAYRALDDKNAVENSTAEP